MANSINPSHCIKFPFDFQCGILDEQKRAEKPSLHHIQSISQAKTSQQASGYTVKAFSLIMEMDVVSLEQWLHACLSVVIPEDHRFIIIDTLHYLATTSAPLTGVMLINYA